MAKKSAHSEEELPFAALMDVMTNVVGVLIIVLVMTGITLAQVAKKVIAQIEIVSEEEFKKIEKEAQDAKAKIDPEKIKEEIKKLDQEIKAVPKIERPPVKVKKEVSDLEALKAKLEDAKKERDTQKQQVETYIVKIKDLQSRLDTKPKYVAPPPAETFKMPNPRPMPKEPVIHHFWITSNAVVTSLADPNLPNDIGNALKQFAKASGLSGSKVEFDTAKLTDYLKKEFYPKYKDINFKPGFAPWTSTLSWTIEPKADPAAPPFEDQVKMGTPFNKILKEISSKNAQNGVVFFHVAPGALENYVKAREVADRMKLNVGWDMQLTPETQFGDKNWTSISIKDFEGVTYSRKVDPNAKAPPPSTPKPDTRVIKGRTGSTLD